jgi:uncharacterized protein
MQFIIMAYDGTDPEAPQRRAAARAAHIALGDRMFRAGQQLYGGAILNDRQEMIGSVIFCEFASRAELDGWLAVEPYVTGRVWQKLEVLPCRVGPSFASGPRP